MQTSHYHIGGISDEPNSTPLAPSTLENKESAKGFRSNAAVSFDSYGFVSKHSVAQSSSSCAGKEELEILPLFMGHGWKLCCCQISLTLLHERQWWGLCLTWVTETSQYCKFLNRQEYFVLIFMELLSDSAEKLFERVCQCTGSTNNFTVVLGLLSILRCCGNITRLSTAFAMLLTLLPTFVMHWCLVVLLRCLLKKCRDQLRNFYVSSTALSAGFREVPSSLKALSHGLWLRAGNWVSWGTDQICTKVRVPVPWILMITFDVWRLAHHILPTQCHLTWLPRLDCSQAKGWADPCYRKNTSYKHCVLLSLICIVFPLAGLAGILFAWFLCLLYLHSVLKIP